MVDAPDPVTPGATLTYTITLKNNGPDAATNGGLNVALANEVTYVNTVVPAGFSCSQFGQSVTCSTPSLTPGTYNLTMTVTVAPHLVSFADGNFTSIFYPSGTTPDPSSGNNQKNITTSYDSPQINMGIAVADAPDPVTPNNDITYTINISNGGPDSGTNATFNSFNNGSLRFQSLTIPAGWSCPSPPSVGSAPTFTCTKPAYANGETAQFLLVVRADPAILGINDGTVSTSFSVSATGNETNNANNSETESTAYVTPDANLGISVTDSPDPVTPNNDITYTVTVTNSGPDTATNVNMNVFNNGSLRHQSISIPSGWNCAAPPSVGSTPAFTCSNPSFVNGATSVFTLVVRADPAILGINDGTVSTSFSVGSSSVADPVSGNNSETEDTAYITPDANLGVTATDSPDPVTPGNNITYTGSVTNAGPDAATSTSLTIPLDANLRFQSLNGPTGFTCGTPSVGATGTITCTNASFANGANVPFTLVAQVASTLLSGPDGTINQNFVIASNNVTDPTQGNNTVTVVTSYQTPDADLSVGVNTGTTNAPIGSTYAYTITVTNNGPDAASNVVMTDILPPSLLFRSITEPSGFTCTTPAVGANGTVTCNALTLPAGATRTFTLTVEVAPGANGPISNSASATSSTSDPNSGNSSASGGVVAAGAAVADVTIAKTTATTSAPPGGTFSYTLTVTNNGPSPATNVIVTDTLPASLQFVSATPSQGTCNNANPLSCNLGTLAVSASATITLNVQVIGTSGTITNTANVSATEDAGGGSSTANPVAITGPQNEGANAPTVSEWGLIAMGVMLAMIALMKMR